MSPAVCNPTPENYIYYPPSYNEAYGQSTTMVPAVILSDLSQYTANNWIYVGQTLNHQNRRVMMQLMMRMLGLPDEYCCNALENIPGTKQEMPFYYYSNPRPRNAVGGCAARPTPNNALPARITVQGVEDTPSICG
jgi:hypothetical protein